MKNILKFIQLFVLIVMAAGLCGFYMLSGSELSGSSLIAFTNKSQPTLENYHKGIWTKAVKTRFDKRNIISRRVIVPIHQTVFPKDVIRYSIPISIGSTDIESMLDTGSPGIRVLPGTMHQSDFVATNHITSEHYGSGVLLKGVIARATVSVGGITSGMPINIAAVETVKCDSQHPNCAASHVSQQNYRIGGGSTGKGFKAIVGVNLAANGRVNNPLPELGVYKWIIILPRPGDTQPGALILNPDKKDLTGYTLFQLDTASSPHDGIPSTITNLRTNKQVNGPAMLDTGAPGVHVVTNVPQRRRLRFKVGDKGQISFTSQSGNLSPMTFTASDKGAAHVKVSLPKKKQPNNGVYAGILPFFNYSVFYDSEHNIIGLKLRERH
jgi:hypothetical protein